MKKEQDGLRALKKLLVQFHGKVDLDRPDCKIYVFDGIENRRIGLGGKQKILARRIAKGLKTSIIAPTNRICITNTPLEPIAAFCLCNVARIKRNDRILDPYCGSAATLLAAAVVASCVETVGVEIAHDGLVNREDIIQDFVTRGLTVPKQLIRGDSTDPRVLNDALRAVGNEPFDAIITDPPYGIRESVRSEEVSPLEELFMAISFGRKYSGYCGARRLLKRGGRLVAFVPVAEDQTLVDVLPNEALRNEAGLILETSREQPLNDKLSRWLVSYKCVS